MTAGAEPHWSLTLYVNGHGPRSAEAIEVVRRLCDAEMTGRFELTVYDASEHPAEVVRDRILALPTLVKHDPGPTRYVVGDLADLERLREALDLGPSSADSDAPDLATGGEPT